MTALHIQDFKGSSGKYYTADLYFGFPFIEVFSETDCIYILITRYHTVDLISCKIEFQENLTNSTYENLDMFGFLPYGIAVIKSSKGNSDYIIDDLKSNKDFYFESLPNQSLS